MTDLSITDAWNGAFAPALPAGFLCRHPLHQRRLRIHSLRKSKRYPETEAEKKELLHRHNSVADYALGNNSDCILFVTRFGESKEWTLSENLSSGMSAPRHVMSLLNDDNPMQFFAFATVWKSHAFDPLILAVADEKTGPILFANLVKASAYAPYDGGADLFFPSASDVKPARVYFTDWLSSRTDGL